MGTRNGGRSDKNQTETSGGRGTINTQEELTWLRYGPSPLAPPTGLPFSFGKCQVVVAEAPITLLGKFSVTTHLALFRPQSSHSTTLTRDSMDLCLQPLTATSGNQMPRQSPQEPWPLVAVALIPPVALSRESGRLRRSASPRGPNTHLQARRAGPGLPRWFPREPLLAVWAPSVPSLSFSECTLAREGNTEKAEILLTSEFTCLTFPREIGSNHGSHVPVTGVWG